MNGHVKPTLKLEGKLEITEPRIQELPDDELDAVAGGKMSDVMVSSVVQKPAEHSKVDITELMGNEIYI